MKSSAPSGARINSGGYYPRLRRLPNGHDAQPHDGGRSKDVARTQLNTCPSN